jgi:hypothetical protein
MNALSAIPGLSTLLSYFQSERHKKTAKEEEALRALLKAIQETNKYIRSGKENPEQEMELSNYWGEAAIAVRKISKDLAERCYIKRGYWKEPDSWSFQEIKEKNIALSDIEEELGKLIRNS